MDLAEQVKRLTVIALVSDDELMDRLVLKGGNAIKLHEPEYVRPSLDIDFSVDGDLAGSRQELRDRFARLLTDTFSREGFHVFDVALDERPPALSSDLEEFWGGYSLGFKILPSSQKARFDGRPDRMSASALVVGPGQQRRCRVDFSKREHCAGKIAVEVDGFTVYVYTPLMIACEKIRAICQQMDEYRAVVKKHSAPRARDFFDIRHLVTRFRLDLGSDEAWLMIDGMFRAKRVPLRLLGRISDDRERHREDFEASVLATIRLTDEPVPSFDEHVDFLVDRLRPLQPRWVEDSPLG